MMSRTRWITATLLTVIACGGEPAARDTAETPAATKAMPSLAMLPAMEAYADSLRTASSNQMRRMVAGAHMRMDTLLAAMETDMRAMNMMGDPAWRALEDSVRADLSTLPALEGEALMLRARAHAGRVRRLLAQHRDMMTMHGM